MEWFKKSADHGNLYAQNNIGELFRYSLGVQQDYKAAIVWLTRAADQSNVYAQFTMGLLFYH
jgi:TPR repeat protein